ncbi:hypothetical protein [Bryobacter aggregatus]|uniref:hypothetical protein n=1 Tax=Bryobacter aggregatus TaxID=360054 RepID=UPI0004E26524|nr:hypothetical protein [Bryobacter aggregatus]
MSQQQKGGLFLHFNPECEDWATNHLSKREADFLMAAYQTYGLCKEDRATDRHENLIVSLVEAFQSGELNATFIRRNFAEFCQLEKIAVEHESETHQPARESAGRGGVLWEVGGRRWDLNDKVLQLCFASNWAYLRCTNEASAEEHFILDMLTTFEARRLDPNMVASLYGQYVNRCNLRDETQDPIPLFLVPEDSQRATGALSSSDISNLFAATVGSGAGQLKESSGRCEQLSTAELVVLRNVLDTLRTEGSAELSDEGDKSDWGFLISRSGIVQLASAEVMGHLRAALDAVCSDRGCLTPMEELISNLLSFYSDGRLDTRRIEWAFKEYRSNARLQQETLQTLAKTCPQILRQALAEVDAVTV